MAFDEGVSSQLLAGLRATAGGDSPWDATVQPALWYDFYGTFAQRFALGAAGMWS
mgnify:CR=1 FL=1